MENIRTMELLGKDSWNRPVYKCIETGSLYKDITLGSENPSLCSCNNDVEGEPDCPIKSSLEIHFVEKPDRPTEEERFNYMLLDRCRSDCDYYLGYGNRMDKYLWAGNVDDHIQKMKDLYNGFSNDKKPEWLSYEEILQYEYRMCANKEKEVL